MDGSNGTHELTDEAKEWLDWFEKSGAFAKALQVHKDYEAEVAGKRAPRSEE